MHRLHLLLAAALLFAWIRPAVAAGPLDWPVPEGQFYTETAGGGGSGFVVSDAGGVHPAMATCPVHTISRMR